MPKLLILGASGAIAQQMIHQFQHQAPTNWSLRLLVRDHHRLPLAQRLRADIIEGDASDVDILATALQNVDVVYSNLGDRHVDRFATSLLTAMHHQHVFPKLVWLAGAGVENEATGETKVIAEEDQDILQQHRHAIHAIETSNLNYTILRPVLLTDSAAKPAKLFPKGQLITEQTVSRATVANVALKACLTETYARQSVGIAE